MREYFLSRGERISIHHYDRKGNSPAIFAEILKFIWFKLFIESLPSDTSSVLTRAAQPASQSVTLDPGGWERPLPMISHTSSAVFRLGLENKRKGKIS